jgi:hypothetical protein
MIVNIEWERSDRGLLQGRPSEEPRVGVPEALPLERTRECARAGGARGRCDGKDGKVRANWNEVTQMRSSGRSFWPCDLSVLIAFSCVSDYGRCYSRSARIQAGHGERHR